MYEIIRYTPAYENALMELIQGEGDDWRIYWEEPNATRYRRSFDASVTFLALSKGRVCGYVRALPDALFLYVCDLLVDRRDRGHGLGRLLMNRLHEDSHDLPVYIMSGSDGYYDKLGCKKEGSIYSL